MPLYRIVAVKEGSPTAEMLEVLAQRIGEKWKKLGRRLKFDESQLTAFHKNNEEYDEKAYAMLLEWKQRDGTSGATYLTLKEALCHHLVNRTDLAEEFCYY